MWMLGEICVIRVVFFCVEFCVMLLVSVFCMLRCGWIDRLLWLCCVLLLFCVWLGLVVRRSMVMVSVDFSILDGSFCCCCMLILWFVLIFGSFIVVIFVVVVIFIVVIIVIVIGGIVVGLV